MPEKFSEEDVKRLYITPAIDRAGGLIIAWNISLMDVFMFHRME